MRLRKDERCLQISGEKRLECKQDHTDGLHIANGSRCLSCLLSKPVGNLSIILFRSSHLFLCVVTISLNYHATSDIVNQTYLNQIDITVHLALI